MRDFSSRILLLALPLGLLAAGCGGTGARGDCADGVDNDADGLIDDNDPGCILNGDSEAPDPDFAACEDGVDNDDDGLIDFPDDPGCAGPGDDDEFDEGAPACRDGIDNDGDGLIDYPNDPGCGLSLEDDESDDCPDGPSCPACANGQDDDGDGEIDYPDDPGCDAAFDDDEFNATVNECGAQVEIRDLTLPGEDTGSLVAGGNNELISACGGSGQEIVYRVSVTEPTALFVTTDFPETTVDTVVYVRSECRDTDTEIACDDDGGAQLTSELVAPVGPGTYFVVVDAHDSGAGGDYKVRIEDFIPEGEECDPDNPQCAPGLVCRLLDDSATVETCELPSCMDGIDNESDGLADFPDDPGCDSETDNDETDDCPDGPGCAECSNGLDDDGDGETDYPEDDGCAAASDPVELDDCAPGVPIELLPESGAMGTTSGPNNFNGSCSTAAQPEDVYAYDVDLDLLSLTFSTVGSALDTVTYVRFGACGDTMDEIACEDPGAGGEDVVIPNPAQGTYFVFVDGAFAAGDYVLTVSGEVAAGDPCDPASTAIVCESGYYCDGSSSTCVQAACADGTDNDTDGVSDYPDDPGCISPSDNDETDDCPSGPFCPICANEIDEDGDGLTDYPDDPGCVAASDDNEIDECIPGVEVQLLDDSGTTGTTPPSADGSNFTPSCHTSTLSTEDVYGYIQDRDLLDLTFSTVGSTGDNVLSVRTGGDCGDETTEVACENTTSAGETVTLNMPAKDTYFVFVDGDFISEIDYVLTVSGTIAGGGACDPAISNFTCESGYVCNGSICAVAACSDGFDGDSDGLTDFPDDPGCASPSDDDETDDCPSGPNCAACANEVDDDGDGASDFPDDPGCAFPGDDDESDCPGESDPVGTVTMGTATGSTLGLTDDFTAACASSTAPDKVYSLQVPGFLNSLRVDTIGSTLDTILTIKAPTCADADLACNDEGDGPFGTSTIELVDLPAGSYQIIVDGWLDNAGDFTLNVSGELAAGEACDPALEAAGVFTCEAGYACDGSICAVAVCGDGVDNDGDGLTDFPNDPGCSSAGDTDEADDCDDAAPMSCPACADGADNDGDGDIDYPDDAGCQGVWDPSEIACADSDPVLDFSMSPEMGDTSTATDDFTPACSTTSTAPDVAYTLVLPGDMNTLNVDTLGSSYDTVLSLHQDSCGGALVSCNDDEAGGSVQSELQLSSVAAGTYMILVDGYMSSSGGFTLNVSGEITSGQPCDPAQTFLSCPAGESCTDSGGGFMCQ